MHCHFSLSAMKQKKLCSAGSGFGLEGVYLYTWRGGGGCVPCGGTTKCCAEWFMVYIRGVNEARGSCQRCLSVMVVHG